MSSESHQLLIDIKTQINEAISGLKGVRTETEGLSGSLGGMQSALSTASGMLMRDFVQGAASSYGEAAKLGAEIDTLQLSFDAMKEKLGAAGLSLESLRQATKGTVSDVDLLKAANQAMALGLPTADLNDLFSAAMNVGHAMGRTTLQAVNDLTTGMGRQSKLILDNLGILVDTDKAYVDYATTLGHVKSETEMVATAEAASAKIRLDEIDAIQDALVLRKREVSLTEEDAATRQELIRAINLEVLELDKEAAALETVSQQTKIITVDRKANVAMLTDEEKKTAFLTAAIESLSTKSADLGDNIGAAQLKQEQFNTSMVNLKTSVGGALGPLGSIQPILQGFMPMFGSLATQLLPKVGSGLLSVVKGLFSAGGATNNLTGTMGGLVSSLGGPGAAGGGLIAGLTGSVGSLGGLGTSLVSLATGPIGIGIAAVSALALAYSTNFLGMRDAVEGFNTWMEAERKRANSTQEMLLKEQINSVKAAMDEEVRVLEDAKQKEIQSVTEKYAEMAAKARANITDTEQLARTLADIETAKMQKIKNIGDDYNGQIERATATHHAKIKSLNTDLKAAVETTYNKLMSGMSTTTNRRLGGIVESWESSMVRMEDSVGDMAAGISGWSIWPDMFKDMERQEESGLRALTKGFKKFGDVVPELQQKIMVTGPTPVKARAPGPLTVSLNFPNANFSSQIDFEKGAERAIKRAGSNLQAQGILRTY